MKANRHRGSSIRKGSKRVLVPFRYELDAIQKEYDYVISALDGGDPASLRIAACHLALAWLRMESAFIQFIERSPAGLALGPRARRERSVLSASNRIARALLHRALVEMLGWNASPDELRALREIVCWLYERLTLCSVVGFPDLSSPHAAPDGVPSAGSHGRAGRSRARQQMGKRWAKAAGSR